MRYNEISETTPKPKKPKLSKNQKFQQKASDYGYEVETLPKHFWNNDEVNSFYIDNVYEIVHWVEGADDSTVVGRAYDEDEIVQAILKHAAVHEPDLLK